MRMSKRWKKALPAAALLAVCLLLFTATAFAEKSGGESGKTYYVSSSTGNDENDGLSEATAWKSLDKISELTLGAGDEVLLKRGDRWVGELLRLYSPAGTQEAPAQLGAYGEGEKPKIAKYEDSVPKHDFKEPLIRIENAEHFVVDGLDIGFCGVGMDLHYEKVTNREDVHVQNCHFHDIYGFFQGDTLEYPHAVGIVVTAYVPIPGCTDPVIRGLYIDGCTSYDAGALYTYGARWGSIGDNVADLIVTNCVMRNNGEYGIAVCNMTGGYMDNCKIIDCGSRYAPMGSMGVMIKANGFTIMNCEIAYQQRLEDNPDGGGIDFEHMGYDIDIINCYIHDNSGVGIMLYSSGSDASHQNKRVRIIGNVFENNNRNVYKPGGAEILALPLYSLVDGSIYNNRYMESDNLFTMNMDQSVTVAGNFSYTEEKQGQMWPIYDFDDVRAYVLDGVPLPDLEKELTDAGRTVSVFNYVTGACIGLAAVAVLYVVTAIVTAKKRKKVAA